jgi:hypothetical protein
MLNSIRTLIRIRRRRIRALIPKESLILIRLINNSHDREITLVIPAPRDFPGCVLLFPTLAGLLPPAFKKKKKGEREKEIGQETYLFTRHAIPGMPGSVVRLVGDGTYLSTEFVVDGELVGVALILVGGAGEVLDCGKLVRVFAA